MKGNGTRTENVERSSGMRVCMGRRQGFVIGGRSGLVGPHSVCNTGELPAGGA